MTEAVALARKHAMHLLRLFTALHPEGIAEAGAAAVFFEQQGVAPSRVILERRWRNIHENALDSMQLPGVDTTGPWLLITSASHMPSAYAVLKKTGWNVEPFPVDYQTAKC